MLPNTRIRLSDVRLVVMTTPNVDVAERIVRGLVDEGVVACGNILPGARSIYRWQGGVESESETIVLLKTTVAQVPRLLQRAPELHPYDVPELLVVDVTDGHPPYLRWVETSVAELVGENGA